MDFLNFYYFIPNTNTLSMDPLKTVKICIPSSTDVQKIAIRRHLSCITSRDKSIGS